MSDLRADIVRVLTREPWLTAPEIASRLAYDYSADFVHVLHTSNTVTLSFDGSQFRFALANDCSASAISALVDLAGIEVTPPDWREPHMTAEDYYAA